MSETTLPSLEQLIRAKIQRRIIAAMALLFAGAIIITVVEAAFSYSDLVARLDRRADALQDLIISEVLVNNQDATNHILADANRETPDQTVRWITPAESKQETIARGIAWHFPGTWTFARPLKRLGDQDFGTFIFGGNFFMSGGLVTALTHRLAFTVAICLLIAILLLPIARKAPKELILGPVQHLLALIREDSGSQMATAPAFAEIKSIQDDFSLLMNDRRRLESQRIETAQLRGVAQTAQMLAHDIRRPFSLLKATLDGLSQASTPELVQEIVTETVPGVRKSLKHLEGIISELIVTEPTNAQFSTFAISEVIRNSVSLAMPSGTTTARVSINMQSDVHINGVQNQLERVVANIVANAFEAMGHNDYVTIATRRVENQVEVSISNTGSYIPPEIVNDIFSPFFTRGKSAGTGLGLAICKRIVSAHNGTIWAESTKEPASVTIHFSLPIWS